MCAYRSTTPDVCRAPLAALPQTSAFSHPTLERGRRASGDTEAVERAVAAAVDGGARQSMTRIAGGCGAALRASGAPAPARRNSLARKLILRVSDRGAEALVCNMQVPRPRPRVGRWVAAGSRESRVVLGRRQVRRGVVNLLPRPAQHPSRGGARGGAEGCLRELCPVVSGRIQYPADDAAAAAADDGDDANARMLESRAGRRSLASPARRTYQSLRI
ncbi:hypothetical protein HETIRDRAFT_456417 [Heterobasidion irregulare TC 32-1]|uniref:Uncharacterized protein n=1 Tax=Heterobasidion irregulare (strain TC 32-1) TaxID=747525 RepID=W4JMY3_HETIT|nr:uncharacterized protein HETIRDRAFT_456417 [Heterobasidion irregulare TC 32-1]ETW74917.1 hypothetical protein HETIRDRAFT_456417 [Heterobasidion irregulare TC 32-1]